MLKNTVFKTIIFFTVFPIIVTACEAKLVKSTNGSIELIAISDPLALSKKEAAVLSEKLINDPLTLFNQVKEYERELERDNALLSREVIQNKFKINREQNPIFLIGECNSGMCGLSRCQNSSRSFYEKTVVKYLKNYKDQKRINFVAFASGSLFQELIILAQAVCLHDIKNINIHVVDPSYGFLIEALSTIDGQSNVINIADYNNFNFHNYSMTKESTIERQQACEKHLTVKQELFRQFLSMVKQLSDNHVKVFVHRSTEAYCQFCAQCPEMRADVVSAMDLEPEFRYETAMKDYYSLVYHALKKGGVAILADNDLGAEKLNMIDFVAHKAPNALCWIKHLFYETTLKHVVDLSYETIYAPLQYLNRFNTAFVGVYSKQAECSDECLQSLARTFAGCCNNYSALSAELKKLDNNKFVSHKNEFLNISTTKKTFGAVLLLASGIYTARWLRN